MWLTVLWFLTRVVFTAFEIYLAVDSATAAWEISSKKTLNGRELSPWVSHHLRLLLPTRRIFWPLRLAGLWIVLWAFWSVFAVFYTVEWLFEDIDKTSWDVPDIRRRGGISVTPCCPRDNRGQSVVTMH